MEETWGKNGGNKNETIDCSSSTFTAQTDNLFEILKGEMVTNLISCTYPSRPNEPRAVA